MTNRQLAILIVAMAVIAGAVVWYEQLTPLQRCWTEKCRDIAIAEEFDAINARYAAQLEASDRELDRTRREIEATRGRINAADEALAELNRTKNGQ